MKRLLLASCCALVCSVLAAGCGGSSAALSPGRFAGTYNGTWVHTTDLTDAGTSTWTFSPDGAIDGTDTDPGRHTTFHVVGHIDAVGHVTTTSTPTGGDPATLTGTLAFDVQSRLSGILVWGVTPPLNYRYTLTRQ
ncbi:hypothetical protein [Fimbriimonas ginsengisoli]|nr:hypothetical protein [Fimbriimonas ginsengisoli]